MCDPFEGFNEAKYVSDVPGTSLSDITEWMANSVHEGMNDTYAHNICRDGFGLIVKILRDIKSSWKLLLTELETFLEDMNETLDDNEIIAAAGMLHRQYLLSIYYFQRQLFYHERYVTYLTGQVTSKESTITPGVFQPDFQQEHDALKVVGLRLNALRQRTTAVLDMVLSLNSIKQTMLQSQDAKIAIGQGESVRKLTLITMAFLPPSFVASVFGINTKQTQSSQIWVFVVVTIAFSLVSMCAVLLRIAQHSTRKAEAFEGTGSEKEGFIVQRWISSALAAKWMLTFRFKSTKYDTELGIPLPGNKKAVRRIQIIKAIEAIQFQRCRRKEGTLWRMGRDRQVNVSRVRSLTPQSQRSEPTESRCVDISEMKDQWSRIAGEVAHSLVWPTLSSSTLSCSII